MTIDRTKTVVGAEDETIGAAGNGANPPPLSADGAAVIGEPDAGVGTGLLSSGWQQRILRSKFLEQYAIVVMLVALVGLFSGLEPGKFFTLGNLQASLTSSAALLILTVALSIALAAGEFDLSIGGVIGLSAILIAKLPGVSGLDLYSSLIVVMLIALFIGGVNSFFVVRIGANSFVVTLAMGTLLVGLGLGLSGSQTLGTIPPAFVSGMAMEIGGIGIPFWGALVLTLLAWFVLEHTPTGRYVLFTGEGREAARLAGVRVNRMRTIGLMTASLGACLAGLIIVGQSAAASSTFGTPYLLQALAAAFLGTTTIKVGRFNVIGTLIGVALLTVGTTGLELLGLSSWSADVFDGAVLIAAVTFAQLVRVARARQR